MFRPLLMSILLISIVFGTGYAADYADGVYKVGKKKFTYSYKRDGKQVAVVWTPNLPDNDKIVFDAVRHSIGVVYGKNALLSPSFETVNVQGTGLMKFSARGRYILVTIVKEASNGKVAAWSMFESDK